MTHARTQSFLSAEKNWNYGKVLLDETLIDEGISYIARYTNTIIDPNQAPMLLNVHPHGIGFGYKLARQYQRLDFDVEEAHIDLKDDVIIAHPPINRIQGRTIIIAIPLLTHGRDLHAVKEWCAQQGARDIYGFCLIDVKSARDEHHQQLSPNYSPFRHHSANLMGFGLGDSCFANRAFIKTLDDNDMHAIERIVAIGAESTPLYHNENVAANTTAIAEFTASKATITKLSANTEENAKNQSIYYNENAIATRIDEHAIALDEELSRENYLAHGTLLLFVLDGALTYGASLMLRMTGYFDVGTIKISRYGSSQQGGAVTIQGEPSVSVEGRDVIAVDELIEHGETLKAVDALCKEKGAKSVRFVTLFHKEIPRSEECKDIHSSLPSLPVPNRWGIGMGLDETPLGRNLPFLLLHPAKPKADAPLHAVESSSVRLD